MSFTVSDPPVHHHQILNVLNNERHRAIDPPPLTRPHRAQARFFVGEGRRGVESLGSCELLVRVWVGEGAGGLGFGWGREGGGVPRM
jgi:hypothetical protein